VRAKPANVAWKPAPSSPPSNASETTEHEERKTGGMSASDAKESIGKGGSLKERMAALQGKGAFGGGAAAGPPPIGPKPVKRPPLVVPPPLKEESEVQVTALEEAKPGDELQKSEEPPESDVRDDADVDHTGSKDAIQKEDEVEPIEAEQDEEARERERRAAIAARMARLGGARVGLAPPVVGKKSEVKDKPKATPQETSPSDVSGKAPVPVEEHASKLSQPPDVSISPPKVDPLQENNGASSDAPQFVAGWAPPFFVIYTK
jgi:myosin tail region-interacting protein MTI1